MNIFQDGFRRLSIFALPALLAGSPAAFADKIGGSSLPSAKPSLKGRIADDAAATSAFVIGANVGVTSNAGPTFLETPSAFLDRAFGYAAVRQTGIGRVDLGINLSDRLYAAFDDADEQSAAAAVNILKDWRGQQTLVALALSRSRDVEERLTEASMAISHAWSDGKVKPYLKGEVALLDYDDIPEEFEPFRNQDDRDRVSSRAEIGLRMSLTEHVEMEIGTGLDSKRYLDAYDDFGVRRDSLSLFPLVGLAYTGEHGTLRALYMPLWRTYGDELFPSRWRHAYSVDAEASLSSSVKAFAAARHGFQETDFLIASSAYEAVVVGGITLTLGKGTLSFAASETRRTYDDLDLVEVDRADRKIEVALTGEMPLTDTISLNGRIGYLDFHTSFGDVGTDAVTASLGLTYAATQ